MYSAVILFCQRLLSEWGMSSLNRVRLVPKSTGRIWSKGEDKQFCSHREQWDGCWDYRKYFKCAGLSVWFWSGDVRHLMPEGKGGCWDFLIFLSQLKGYFVGMKHIKLSSVDSAWRFFCGFSWQKWVKKQTKKMVSGHWPVAQKKQKFQNDFHKKLLFILPCRPHS